MKFADQSMNNVEDQRGQSALASAYSETRSRLAYNGYRDENRLGLGLGYSVKELFKASVPVSGIIPRAGVVLTVDVRFLRLKLEMNISVGTEIFGSRGQKATLVEVSGDKGIATDQVGVWVEEESFYV